MKYWLLAAVVITAGGCGGSDQPIDALADESQAPGAEQESDSQAFARDCTWIFNSDPDLVNIAFPDTAANYWAGYFAIPPGGEVRVVGEFPHARYMSFNAYDVKLAAYDSIADQEILPDEGSHNPFLPGADRNVGSRTYTLRMVGDPPPENPEDRQPNTLYMGYPGVPMPYGNLIYRIYVPDRGASLAGNVDLPRFQYVLPDGTILEKPEVCAFLERTRLEQGINQTLIDSSLLQSVSGREGTEPVAWTKFVGLGPSLIEIVRYVPLIADLPIDALWDALRDPLTSSGGSGGFLANQHNAYVTGTVNREFGEIAVISAKAPDTPSTYENDPIMQAADLRYWSLCTNDIYTQRYYDCAYDSQIPVDANGNFTVVISRPELRPANARIECGVAWLHWGPRADSFLIYRHMLASPDFAHSIQSVPDGSGSEAEVMGPYYPFGTHASVEEFEALSIDPQGDALTCGIDASSLRQRAGAQF